MMTVFLLLLFQIAFGAFEFDVYVYSLGGLQTPVSNEYSNGSESGIFYIDPITKTTKSENLIAPTLTSGLNVVIINEQDAMFIEATSYSSYSSSQETTLQTYLNSLPNDRIIIISSYDTAETFTSIDHILTSWGNTCGLPEWKEAFIFVGTTGTTNPTWTFCERTIPGWDDSLPPLNRSFTLPFVNTWYPTDDPTNAPTSTPTSAPTNTPFIPPSNAPTACIDFRSNNSYYSMDGFGNTYHANISSQINGLINSLQNNRAHGTIDCNKNKNAQMCLINCDESETCEKINIIPTNPNVNKLYLICS
eukprot:491912_1